MYLLPKLKFDRYYVMLWSIVGGRFIEPLIIPFLALWIKAKKRYIRFSSKILISFLGIIIYSCLIAYYHDYSYTKLFQQFVVLLLLFLSYDIIFQSLKYNLDILFDKYLKIAYYVSVLGILQFVISTFFHFNLFSFITLRDTVNRVSSLFIEPGYLGQFLIPAMGVIVLSQDFFKKHTLLSFVIIVCYLLSFSAIAYFIGFLMLLKRLYTLYDVKLIRAVCVLLLCYSMVYIGGVMTHSYESDSSTKIGQINMKIVESQKMLNMTTPEDFAQLNLSSFALASNLYVARNAPDRLLGTGLGSHESNYNRVYKNVVFTMILNSTDGYSLLIRILSEFGYVGVLVYLFWVYRHFNSRNIINVSTLFFLISIMLRGGHYFMYGVIFFHFIYYYTSSLNKSKQKN